MVEPKSLKIVSDRTYYAPSCLALTVLCEDGHKYTKQFESRSERDRAEFTLTHICPEWGWKKE